MNSLKVMFTQAISAARRKQTGIKRNNMEQSKPRVDLNLPPKGKLPVIMKKNKTKRVLTAEHVGLVLSGENFLNAKSADFHSLTS